MDVAYMHRLAEVVHDPLTDELKAKVLQLSDERVRWFEEPDERALHDGGERAVAPLL
jgi:hypothetical protein